MHWHNLFTIIDDYLDIQVISTSLLLEAFACFFGLDGCLRRKEYRVRMFGELTAVMDCWKC